MWRDDKGRAIDLRLVSPRMLKWQLGGSLERKLGHEMAARWEDSSLTQQIEHERDEHE